MEIENDLSNENESEMLTILFKHSIIIFIRLIQFCINKKTNVYYV
jgi:hypothetical protein